MRKEKKKDQRRENMAHPAKETYLICYKNIRIINQKKKKINAKQKIKIINSQIIPQITQQIRRVKPSQNAQ